jgi:hypothetical protein
MPSMVSMSPKLSRRIDVYLFKWKNQPILNEYPYKLESPIKTEKLISSKIHFNTLNLKVKMLLHINLIFILKMDKMKVDK